KGPDEQPWPRREELCPVPIGQIKTFLENTAELTAYRKDHLEDKWVRVRHTDVRPGMVLLLHRDAGGYDWDGQARSGRGWCGERDEKADEVPKKEPTPGEGEEGVGADRWSQGPPQRLRDHTVDVCAELDCILAELDLEAGLADHLRRAARW